MINKPVTPFNQIDSEQDLDALLARSHAEPVVLFKHSLTCGLSARAYSRLVTLTGEGDPMINLVPVQTARPVSDRIESELGVRHESPQLLIVYKGQSLFDSSHHKVSADVLLTALAELKKPAT